MTHVHSRRSDGPRASPLRPPIDSSVPAVIELYLHKPLPPLPATLHPNRGENRPRAATEPRHVRTWSCPRPHPHRISYSGLTATGRRSSRKVHQLTGYDVDVMDDCRASYGSMDSDSSSNYNQPWEGHVNFVPLSETGGGGEATSNRMSPWGPTWPYPALVPAPLHVSKSGVRGGGCDSGVHLVLDEEPAVRRWDPAHGQFSDTKAAGEYHRIATELAAQHGRQRGTAAPAPPTSRWRKRPSLSFSLGGSARFSRWRSSLHPADLTPALSSSSSSSPSSSSPSSPAGRDELPPSQRPVDASRVVQSAFDSDSSDEEDRGGRILDWFGRKSDEHDGAGPRASTGEHVRELLHQARDRAKMLQLPREERRREEPRHMRAISA